MKIEGSTIHNSTIELKCEKYLKSIKRKKNIDPQSIGSQHNNNLLDLMFCQSKTRKSCKRVEKMYKDCHKSVMGTGSFEGRKNCGNEFMRLYECTIGH